MFGSCKTSLITYRMDIYLTSKVKRLVIILTGIFIVQREYLKGYYSNGYIYDDNHNIVGNYANGYVKMKNKDD